MWGPEKVHYVTKTQRCSCTDGQTEWWIYTERPSCIVCLIVQSNTLLKGLGHPSNPVWDSFPHLLNAEGPHFSVTTTCLELFKVNVSCYSAIWSIKADVCYYLISNSLIKPFWTKGRGLRLVNCTLRKDIFCPRGRAAVRIR